MATIAWTAALASLILFHVPKISLVIGIAMMITFTWAGLIGLLAPLTLKRLGADPAGSAEQGLCPGLVSAAELFAPNVANLRSSILL